MALYKIDKDAQGQPTGDLDLVAGGTLWADAPIGTIFPFLSSSIPAGFLLCDGTAYSATDYPELWAILPSTVKDTTNNTFTIDLRETTLKGAGLTGETVGNHLDADGLAVGEFLDDRIGIGDNKLYTARNSAGNTVQAGSGNWGEFKNYRSGDTTEVKSRGVNFIIKAKMVAVPADFMSAVEEVVGEMGVHFEENVVGIGAGQTSRSYTITKAGYYFIYAHGNPYANNLNFMIELYKGDNLITKGSSAVTGFDHISVEHIAYCSVGDVIYAKFANLTTDSNWNSWGLFRITT